MHELRHILMSGRLNVQTGTVNQNGRFKSLTGKIGGNKN